MAVADRQQQAGDRGPDPRRDASHRRQARAGPDASVTYEITEHDPPRKVTFNGVNGPVRPVGTVTVEPIGDGGSKVTIELDLHGNGLLGAIIAPLARSQARRQLPEDQRQLKERLESETGRPAA